MSLILFLQIFCYSETEYSYLLKEQDKNKLIIWNMNISFTIKTEIEKDNHVDKKNILLLFASSVF